MARLLRFHFRSKTKPNNSRILFFSTSNSNSPFSSLFGDIKSSLKNQPQQQQQQQQQPSTDRILKNLSEFRQRASPPPPNDSPSQQRDEISFQDIYHRKMDQNPGKSVNVQAIRESLRNITPRSPASVSGLRRIPSGPLPESVSGREATRRDGSVSLSLGFLKTYGVEDLGEKLRMLRPEERGKDWFSLKELSERLVKLRIMEEQSYSNAPESDKMFKDLRDVLKEMDRTKQENTNKASLQGRSILGHLSGTPTFSLEPPKLHLVEKYFHPDNMSSAEKLKIELAKVRDEFKMSESDCGSARVQIALLTTKIKHLSAVLHKKDVHSRKGLLAMVQRRKRLLKYLRRTDWDSYCFVISKLGLRDNPEHSYKARSGMAA